MSWLGDQFNSLTGKLSDFTKEVLTENIDTSSVAEEDLCQNGVLSAKELSVLCKEKDYEIKNLMQEKECLESSIEELAQQQQDAIDALLSKKNEVVAENKLLKDKLSQLESQQTFENFGSALDKNLASVRNNVADTVNSLEVTGTEEDEKSKINLQKLLGFFTKGCNEDGLKQALLYLENQKELLINEEENQEHANKINSYIIFLQTLLTNCEFSFPIIDEVCGAFKLLLCHNNELSQRLTSLEQENKELNTNCKSRELLCVNNASEFSKSDFKPTCDLSMQTESCKAVTVEVSSQVDSFEPKISVSTETAIVCHSSKDSQTDLDQDKELDEVLCGLKSRISSLECEKLKLLKEISDISPPSKLLASVYTETENICRCDSLQSELEVTKKSLTNVEHLCNGLRKEQADNFNDFKEKLRSRDLVISEKDTVIQSQKKEIVSLIGKIKSLNQEVRTYKSKESPVSETTNCLIPMQKSNENETALNSEVKNFQEKVKTLELEKGKLLCVLNEKSQECSSLKSEVHKLTSIVASEKQALLKLQQDNCELKHSNKDNTDPELTKEAIRKLSNIIRDKEFEIESLKQKNQTLTTLMQDASNIPDHLQSLVEERENLSKQVNLYKDEREKFMANFNTKDKKCREYAAEVKELSSILSEQRNKFDQLEQKHLTVAQQYEEKQKSLINTQNEMIVLKQRVSDLEHQQVDIKEKYSDLLNKLNADGVIQLTKEELSEKDARIESLTVANEEKDHLIQEKDCMIHDLSQQVKKLKLESEQQQEAIENLGRKTSELMEKIVEMKGMVEDLQAEKRGYELKFQDKNSESALLKDMNERLNMALKEKEFAMQSMMEKISSLSQYINSDHSGEASGATDINQILADSESLFSKAQSLYRERDETLLVLNQSKQENQSLRNEIQRMKSSEIHLKSELERLRQHLLEIEENYTTEAVKSADKEKRLQDELFEVRRRAEINSSAVVDTSQRASIQIASLQEQLSMLANQRDEALAQISTLEDQVIHHSTAVNKLQLVLEQMQRGSERKLKEAESRFKLEVEKYKNSSKQMEDKLQIKQKQLEESSKALEAATRLSEQLDAKEELIAHLKAELSKTESKIKSTTLEMDSIRSNTEGKVDRVVMKSLVLGYFSTPAEQKSEVIRLLARVLDFNQEEMEKAGIVVGRQVRTSVNRGGLFSSIFNRLPSLTSQEPVQRGSGDKSFTTLFVQFLENESQPIIPMPFPVEHMAKEITLKAPHSNWKTPQDKPSPQRRSPLLMDIDSAFPSFTPIPAVEYSLSPAPAVLKEVLE